MDEAVLTIGQVAAQAGVNASAIRYYERVGLLPQRESGQLELALVGPTTAPGAAS